MPWYLGLLNWAIELWNNTIQTGIGILSQSPEAMSPSVYSAIKTINASLQGVAYGLLVLFFLVSLFKHTTNLKDFTLQGVIGYFMRFIVAKIAIDYCMVILTSIVGIGLDIVGIVNDTASNVMVSGVPQEIIDLAGGIAWYDILSQIGLFLLGLVGVLIACVCSIMFLLTIYGRFFKVYVHIALAPLALSSFGGSETSQNGKRFLMSFASVCLEAAVIMVGIVISSGIIGSGGLGIVGGTDPSVFTQLADYILSTCFGMILLVTLTKGVSRLTKEMFGG